MPSFDELELEEQATRERGWPDAVLAAGATLLAVGLWALVLYLLGGGWS